MKQMLMSLLVILLGASGCSQPKERPSQNKTQVTRDGLPLLAAGKAPSSQRVVIEAAIERSRVTGRPLMVKVGGVWCGPCRYFDEKLKEVQKDPEHPLTKAISQYDLIWVEEGFVESPTWDFIPAPAVSFPVWFLYHPATSSWATTFNDLSRDFTPLSPLAEVLNAFREQGTQEKTFEALIKNQSESFPVSSLVGLRLVKDANKRAEYLREAVKASLTHGGLKITRTIMGITYTSIQTNCYSNSELTDFFRTNLKGILPDSEIAALTDGKRLSRRAFLAGLVHKQEWQKAYEFWKSSPDGIIRLDIAHVLKEVNAPQSEIDSYLSAFEAKFGTPETFSTNTFSYVNRAKTVLGRPVDFQKALKDLEDGIHHSVTKAEEQLKEVIKTESDSLATAQSELDKEQMRGMIVYFEFLLERNKAAHESELRVYREFFRRLEADPTRLGKDGISAPAE